MRRSMRSRVSVSAADLSAGETGRKIGLRRIFVRQFAHGKYQPGRFVDRVVGAVAVHQAGVLESSRDQAYELLDVRLLRL